MIGVRRKKADIAITHYNTLDENKGLSLIEFQPLTSIVHLYSFFHFRFLCHAIWSYGLSYTSADFAINKISIHIFIVNFEK